MNTKIIPFDLEMAEKIQAGEIEGKIKYCEGDGYTYNADIIKFDLIADKSRAIPNSTLFRTIVAVIDFDNHQGVRTFNTDGYGCNSNGDDAKLFIEVPDNEHQFKPFDKVLVRDYEDGEWIPAFFGFYTGMGGSRYRAVGGSFWRQCIPYAENENLVGTTDKPKEE